MEDSLIIYEPGENATVQGEHDMTQGELVVVLPIVPGHGVDKSCELAVWALFLLGMYTCKLCMKCSMRTNFN